VQSERSHVRAVDLFCGAGGLSAGLALACEDLDRDVDLTAVNHWTKAIETHKRNHPWAEHYNTKVEALQPRAVVDGDVDLLTAGPECTHFSRARGGSPVDEQRRASPWHVIDWIAKLLPENVLVENVPELQSWGPVIDGSPTRNGTFFEAWVETLRGLGYSVAWRVLNAADHGDATTRKRLFVVARRGLQPEWPAPTHSEGGLGDTEPHRPASEIIDWSETGESIWRRSRPLVQNTMERIADGLERHGDAQVAAYADAVAALGKADVESMQADVVAASEAADAVATRDEPFLVSGPSLAVDDDDEAFVLGQHGGSVARDTDTDPLPTVATKGAISLSRPTAFVLPRNGARRGLHSNPAYDPDERPLHTVTAKNHDGWLVSPFLVEYYGNGKSQAVDEPLPTVTTKDRFALVVPELFPVGLDIRFRMLQPRELAAAMGFPTDYEFAGNKTETTEQIGNAVPVNLASALCKKLLTGEEPTLGTFTDQPVAADGGEP
jgi:DNA (cytosine-5)-methyltransferase 1